MKTVMVVDDDTGILNSCQRILRCESIRCVMFSSPEKALEQIEKINPEIVLSDQYMKQLFGTVFLKRVQEKMPEAVRILMTGHPDITPVVSAVMQGIAFTFIKKPWTEDIFKETIHHALEYHSDLSKVHQ